MLAYELIVNRGINKAFILNVPIEILGLAIHNLNPTPDELMELGKLALGVSVASYALDTFTGGRIAFMAKNLIPESSVPGPLKSLLKPQNPLVHGAGAVAAYEAVKLLKSQYKASSL